MLPGVQKSASSLQDSEDITQAELNRIGALIEQENENTDNLICMVYGSDGTAKTGLILSYLIKNDKKTLYLDIDGNSGGLLSSIYNNNKLIRLINPRKSHLVYNKRYDLTTPEIDYKASFNEIKLIAYYLEQNTDKFDAVVVDGASTLLDYAQQQMRMDKNIDPDGAVNMKYWMNRNKIFLDVLDLFRNINNMDKIFAGHENFISVPGTKSISMGGELVKIGNTSSVVEKTNRMMDERIYMEVTTKDGAFDPAKNMDYKIIATIHKFRPNADKVLNKYVVLEKKDGKTIWHDEVVDKIFKLTPDNIIEDSETATVQDKEVE